MIEVRGAGPDDAEVMHAVMLAAFATHAQLDPPSGALRETVDDVRAALSEQPGLIATDDGEPVGGLRIELKDGVPHVRRVSVLPDHQGRGICRALMERFEDGSRAAGHRRVGLGVRAQLTANRELYEHLGYVVVTEHRHPDNGRPHWYELAKDLR